MFPNDTVTIYEEVVSASICGVDLAGKPLKCINQVDIVMGDLQEVRPEGSRQQFGQADQSSHRLILDVDIDITRLDKVDVEGYGMFSKKRHTNAI